MPTVDEVDEYRMTYLRQFRVPLRPCIFFAIFKPRMKARRRIYTPDAYKFDNGDMIHLHEACWLSDWKNLPTKIPALIQIHDCEQERSDAPLSFAIYENKPDRSGLFLAKRIHTTQGQFLEFLKTFSWKVFDGPDS